MKKTYSEKLKDPRWQKKRLEIMQEREFKCENCESPTQTLHIHHCYYSKSLRLEPWEYESKTLKCLCEPCHNLRQELEDKIQIKLSEFNHCELFFLERIISVLISICGIFPVLEFLNSNYRILLSRKIMKYCSEDEETWRSYSRAVVEDFYNNFPEKEKSE